MELTKFNEQQVEKIKKAVDEMRILSQAQDKIYNDLVVELHMEQCMEAYSRDEDIEMDLYNSNPVPYLFDLIYGNILSENPDDAEIELAIARIDQKFALYQKLQETADQD